MKSLHVSKINGRIWIEGPFAQKNYVGLKRHREVVRMVEYVKGSETDKWHWCKNCTQYPMYIYLRRSRRPRSDLCSQCKEKEDNKSCIT